MDVRKEVLAQQKRRENTMEEAGTPRKETSKRRDGGLWAVCLFETVCFAGGVAIWFASIVSNFYFVLTTAIVVVLMIVALWVEAAVFRWGVTRYNRTQEH